MKNLTKVILSLAVLVLSLGFTSEVSADPVVITSGFVQIGGPPPPPSRGSFRATSYSLTGDNFTVSGSVGDGDLQHPMSLCTGGPCPAGTLISANGVITLQGLGSTTLNGVTLPFLTTAFGAPFTFVTPSVPIPPGSGTLTVTIPFTMLPGSLDIFIVPGAIPLFSTTISGSGIATLTLEEFEGGHVLTVIRYDFQTPEPTTLLLFVTGLTGLAIGAWRRQKRVY